MKYVQVIAMAVWVAVVALAAVEAHCGTVQTGNRPCQEPCCLKVAFPNASGGMNYSYIYRCEFKSIECTVRCFGKCSWFTGVTTECPGQSETTFACGDHPCPAYSVCRFTRVQTSNMSTTCTGPSVDNCEQFVAASSCDLNARAACEAVANSTCGTMYTIECPVLWGAGR
jgi:hypothetical protein